MVSPALARERPRPLTRLDAQVARAMQEFAVPGMAVAVIKDGQVVHARGYGVRRLGWDDPVTTHLPEFQMYDPWVTRELTLRDLATHRSGLGLGQGILDDYLGAPAPPARARRPPSRSCRSRATRAASAIPGTATRRSRSATGSSCST